MREQPTTPSAEGREIQNFPLDAFMDYEVRSAVERLRAYCKDNHVDTTAIDKWFPVFKEKGGADK